MEDDEVSVYRCDAGHVNIWDHVRNTPCHELVSVERDLFPGQDFFVVIAQMSLEDRQAALRNRYGSQLCGLPMRRITDVAAILTIAETLDCHDAHIIADALLIQEIRKTNLALAEWYEKLDDEKSFSYDR